MMMGMEGDAAARDLDDLIAMLEASHAWDDLEGVSILDHGLQTAAILRTERPDDVELQIAGLVHDLGWMHRDSLGKWRPVPDAAHDRDGAVRLRPLLGDRIADLIEGHVDAKRYLVATDAGYRATLSPRSLETLQFQGDTMGTADTAAFELRQNADDLVALRRADDQAKVIGLEVPGLDAWRDVIEVIVSG
jgi:predicted HD phosphohydrolase